MKILRLLFLLHTALGQTGFGRSYLRNSRLCHQWSCVNSKLGLPDALPPSEEFALVLRGILPGSWLGAVERVTHACYHDRPRRFTNTCPGQALMHCAVDQLINNCPEESLRKDDACAPVNSLAGVNNMFSQSRYENLERNLPLERRPSWFLRNYFDTKCCNLPDLINSTVLSECGFTTMMQYYNHNPQFQNNAVLPSQRRNNPIVFHTTPTEASYSDDSLQVVDLKDIMPAESSEPLPDPLECCDISAFIQPAWRHDCGFQVQWTGVNRLTVTDGGSVATEAPTPTVTTVLHRDLVVLPQSILSTLSFYASGSYQRHIGVSAHHKMHQVSVSNCVRAVTQALNNDHFRRKYIHFPQTREERNIIKHGFYQKFGMPGILGCIDGTHIAIVKPAEYEERFFNRKRYHSLNAQVVCDSDLNILSIDASHGGASHDSFVWSHHALKSHLEQLQAENETVWFLGDSGYPLRPTLMTPIVTTEPGTPERYYTDLHCRIRNTVERCIGVLKSRWRCLLVDRKLHYHPTMAGFITNACVVLHNIANAARLPIPPLTPEEERVEANMQCEKETCVFDKLNITSAGAVDMEAFTKLLDNLTDHQPQWNSAKARVVTTCLAKPLRDYDADCDINRVLACTFDVLSENCPSKSKNDTCKHTKDDRICQISSSKSRPKNRRSTCVLPELVNRSVLAECSLHTLSRVEPSVNITTTQKKHSLFSSKYRCKDLTPSTSCVMNKMGALNKYGFMDYFKMKDRIRHFTDQNEWSPLLEAYMSAFTNIPLYGEHCNSAKKLLNVLDSIMMTCPDSKKKNTPQCSKLFADITNTPASNINATKEHVDQILKHFHHVFFSSNPVTSSITHPKYTSKIVKKPIYDYGVLSSKYVPEVQIIDVKPKVAKKPLVLLPVYMRVPYSNFAFKPYHNDGVMRSPFSLHNQIAQTHRTTSSSPIISTSKPVPLSTSTPVNFSTSTLSTSQ